MPNFLNLCTTVSTIRFYLEITNLKIFNLSLIHLYRYPGSCEYFVFVSAIWFMRNENFDILNLSFIHLYRSPGSCEYFLFQLYGLWEIIWLSWISPLSTCTNAWKVANYAIVINHVCSNYVQHIKKEIKFNVIMFINCVILRRNCLIYK